MILQEWMRNTKRYWKANLLALISLTGVFVILSFSLLLAHNVRSAMAKLQANYHISVFLQQGLLEDKVKDLSLTLSKIDKVQGVKYISSENAIDEFLMAFPAQEKLLGTLDHNPLPAAFEITLNPGIYELKEIENLAKRFKEIEGVQTILFDEVKTSSLYQTSLLLYILGIGGGIFLSILAIYLVVCFYQLSFKERKQQTSILYALGAWQTLVTVPIWLEGALYGFAAGLFAIGLLRLFWLLYEIFGSNVKILLSPWMVPSFMPFSWQATFLGLSGLTGLIGGFFAARKIARFDHGEEILR